MELLGVVILIGLALGAVIVCVIVFTRGLFARDLTQALKRVNQQEQQLQENAGILEERIRLMEGEYHLKLQRADQEAKQIVESARVLTMNVRSAAIEEAKHRARQLLLEAEQGRAQLKAEAAKELNGQIVQQTCDALRSLLPTGEMTKLHGALVEQLLAAVKRLDTAVLKANVSHVDVRTAQPLSPAHSQQLAQWVVASLGATVPVHFQTDASLVAGCLLQLGSTTVDSSFANRLRQPASER